MHPGCLAMFWGTGAMIYYGLPTTWGPQVEDLIINEVHTQQVRRASEPVESKVRDQGLPDVIMLPSSD